MAWKLVVYLNSGSVLTATTQTENEAEAKIVFWTANHTNPDMVENEISPPVWNATIAYRLVDVVAMRKEEV